MSNITTITNTITVLIIIMTTLINKLSSLERIQEYCTSKDQESPFKLKSDEKIPKNWPKNGKIEISNLNIKYRKDTPLVLKNLSVSINPGEKVGIVGRTGSGKSTGFLALTRILEKENVENSYLKIDGVDISKLGLGLLRSKIGMIPQDPYLFEGTLKSNLDPKDLYNSERISQILNEIEFSSTLTKDQLSNKKRLEKKDKIIESKYLDSNIIDMEIKKKGLNLSLGQRQLICIARSLIKKQKILLMDEATANIDEKSDEIIRKIIKEKSGGITVLTIAHRLESIIDYDRILVFKDGNIVEDGKPSELKNIRDGFFRKFLIEKEMEKGVGGFGQ